MVTLSVIYTKTGDAGDTGLGDGRRVAKDHARVEAYGTVDELNATLGGLLLQSDIPEAALWRSVQNDLFDLGADLCVPPGPQVEEAAALRITERQVTRLEQAIDRLNEPLTTLRSFVLPGGSPAAVWAHMARTVCRRAERMVVHLHHSEPVNPFALQYLNRLSDLLFVYSRAANGNGANDVLWVPGQSRADG